MLNQLKGYMSTQTAEVKPANGTNAVATTTNANSQIVVEPKPLFNIDCFKTTPNIAKVFGLTAIVDKTNAVVGGVLTLGKRKEIAAALDLTKKEDKDQLDEEIRKVKADAMKSYKGHFAQKSDDWVLHKVTVRRLKDGRLQETAVTQEMPAKDRAILEKFAAAHGVDVNDLAAYLEAKKAKSPVTVESTITTTSGPVAKK